MGGDVKIIVDRQLCTGHGRCYTLSADLFEADEEGYTVLRHDGAIPPSLADQAEKAVIACPEGAIRLVDRGPDGDDLSRSRW